MVFAARQVPPLIAADPVPVGIRSRADRRMSRSRLCVRIAVVAIGKERAVIEQQLESPSLEVAAIALEIIGAELVENQNDDQLRMRVIRGRAGARRRGKSESPDRQAGKKSLGDRHGISSIAKISLMQVTCRTG